MLEKPRKCGGRGHPMTAGCTETMAQGAWPPSHPPTAWVCHPGGSLMMRLRLESYTSLQFLSPETQGQATETGTPSCSPGRVGQILAASWLRP